MTTVAKNLTRGAPKQIAQLQTLRRRLAQVTSDLKDSAYDRQTTHRRKVRRHSEFNVLIAKYDQIKSQIEQLERQQEHQKTK